MDVCMWGNANCPHFSSFEKLAEQAKRARNKIKGKKLANGTYARFDGEDTIVVKLHDTDILKLHRDGNMDIAITNWAITPTTHTRLVNIGEVYVHVMEIPAVNGYKVQCPKQQFISNGYGSGPAYAYNTKKIGKWIRRRPDKTFDESTIIPHELTCIKNTKAMRSAMLHLGRIAKVLKGYARIEGSENPFYDAKKREDVTTALDQWLLERYNTPLDKIDLMPLPFFKVGYENKMFGKWVKSTIASEIRNEMNSIRYVIARNEGWLGTHEVLKLE